MEGHVVVTGAGGNVGSTVGAVLQEHGWSVLGLDLKPPFQRSFPWKYCDLTDRASVMRFFDGAAAVLHIGELPGVYGPHSQDEAYATNVRIGSTVFQTAATLGVPKVFYASSAQVYGVWGDDWVPPDYVPLDENHPVRGRNAYSLGKVANESYLEMVVRQNPSTSGTSFRFPWVWGKWRPWSAFVDRLQAFEGHHDGFGTYIAVDDLAEAFRLALSVPSEGFDVFNVAADDICNLMPVREYLSLHWPDVHLPKDMPPHKSWFDCRKAKEKLGWTPRFSVIQSWEERQSSS